MSELSEISGRLLKVEHFISFTKGAAAVAVGVVIALFGVTNIYQIPNAAKQQVPAAVAEYLKTEEGKASIVDSITDTAQRVSDLEVDARTSVESLKASAKTATNQESALWLAKHAGAAGACAAFGAENVSKSAHVVLPRKAKESCTSLCSRTEPYKMCRGMVAIGAVLNTQASDHKMPVATSYRYACTDAQDAYDEVRGDYIPGSGYHAYCCCFKP